MKLVGLDIGTTTICGLVLDPDTGEVVSVRTEPNASAIPGAAPWEALQDPEAILAAAANIADRFLDAFADVAGIGVAGQMHGILYVDRHGRAVSPLYTWQDGRGDRDFAPGETHAAHLSQRLGHSLSTGMGFVTHHYNTRAGLVPQEAASLCTAADYVAMRLAHAAVPLIDATNAASLGCFDLSALDFRRGAMDGLGIDPSLFPRVVHGYPGMGEARRGVPVFVAVGDNQASFLGAVRDVGSSLLVNIGTGSQLSLFIQNPAVIPGIDTRPFPFGGFLGVGAALCGGRAYALLREFFDRTVRLFTGTAGAASWETMNAVTEASLGAGDRLAVSTLFAGTRAEPGIRGMVSNLSQRTFTPEHLIVGVREGIVSELLDFYDRFPAAARGAVRFLVGSGNGIRLNPDLRAAFARTLGMRMGVPACREETSLGAAILAAVAAGAVPDLAAAGSLVEHESGPT